MFKNGVEATTGIMVFQDVVQQKEVQQMKKYNGEDSRWVNQSCNMLVRSCSNVRVPILLLAVGWEVMHGLD
jgi:hypothetical protein